MASLSSLESSSVSTVTSSGALGSVNARRPRTCSQLGTSGRAATSEVTGSLSLSKTTRLRLPTVKDALEALDCSDNDLGVDYDNTPLASETAEPHMTSAGAALAVLVADPLRKSAIHIPGAACTFVPTVPFSPPRTAPAGLGRPSPPASPMSPSKAALQHASKRLATSTSPFSSPSTDGGGGRCITKWFLLLFWLQRPTFLSLLGLPTPSHLFPLR